MQRRTGCRQQLRRVLAFASGIVLVALTSARGTDYFVNPSGANGAFPTVQSAVDAVAGQTEISRANIFLAPATYVERVTVDKPFVTFIGQGATAVDVIISFNGTPVYVPEFSLRETVSIRGTATTFMVIASTTAPFTVD